MKSGLYVVEGIDGCGKSTAVKIIKDKLDKDDIDYVVVDSYPHTEEGKYLRDMWIQQKVPPMSVLGIVLYLRAQLIRSVILPALAEGKVVIADRWMPTTEIYQCDGEGLSWRLVQEAISFTLSEFKDHPEYISLENFNVFMITADPEIAYSRVKARANLDAFEKRPIKYFQRLAKAYDQTHFCGTNGNIQYIDSNHSILDFTKRIHAAMVEMSD